MDIESVVDEVISQEDLMKFRQAYDRQVKRGEPCEKAAFDYAHALIRGTRPQVLMGIQLLEEILKKNSGDIAHREYIFYLAVAHTRIKNHDRALDFLNTLLTAEPQNRQANDLKAVIERRMRRDALTGAAIIGGAAAVVGGIIVAAFAATRGK